MAIAHTVNPQTRREGSADPLPCVTKTCAPSVPIQRGIERDGTERDETGRSGETIRCEIKALAGNSATCLGFCFRLDAGSIPAAPIYRPRLPGASMPYRAASRRACSMRSSICCRERRCLGNRRTRRSTSTSMAKASSACFGKYGKDWT